ncbi:MAG: 2'-5' RNA ligase family protein [Anaerolineales bacterium]|jgi:2'-5' RNA ligase
MDKPTPPLKVSAIATVLLPPFGDRVQAIWQDFQDDCQVQFTLTSDPIPHISWQGAQHYNERALDEVLAKIASQTRPFAIKTSGIGIFTGPTQIIYLSVVKDANLMHLHRQIWDATQELSENRNTYYSPELWLPHITLAQDSLNAQALDCILAKITFRPYEWIIPVDHLALIHAGEGAEFREKYRYPFSDQE